MTIHEIADKASTGDYIIVYKEVDTLTYNYKWHKNVDKLLYAGLDYKLIHKKHKDILDAYLKDTNVKIFTDDYSDDSHCYYNLKEYFSNENFIDFYNENYNYTI